MTTLSDLVLLKVVSAASASTTVQAIYTVPAGNVLELRNACANGSPGAGQKVVRRGVNIVAPDGASVSSVDLVQSESDGAADDRVYVNWPGKVFVPPSWTVRGDFAFDSGVAANTTTLCLIGVLHPVALDQSF